MGDYFKPDDLFVFNEKSIGLSVLDFWKYAYSDLNADPRDDVAEFLVSHALGISKATNRQNWTSFDILYNKDGKDYRVEVKCTGYYQTWRGDDDFTEHRAFSIRKATDLETKKYDRHNDIYVFCLLKGTKREEANPLVLENWDFYVVPTKKINEKCGENKTISLNRIKSLGIKKVSYSVLKDAIDKLTDIHAYK